MELRDWEALGIFGGKGQGKSGLVRKLITKCYDMRSQKVVILNNTNPPAFQDYMLVQSPGALMKRWRGVVRYHNPNGCRAGLEDICKLIADGYISNGCVVLDDCTKYIDPNVKHHVKEILVDHRMRDLDLMFTTHALRFMPPFCRAMISTITVFKTGETFDRPAEIKALGYPNYNELFNAWKIIEATPEVKKPKDFIQPFRTIETGV